MRNNIKINNTWKIKFVAVAWVLTSDTANYINQKYVATIMSNNIKINNTWKIKFSSLKFICFCITDQPRGKASCLPAAEENIYLREDIFEKRCLLRLTPGYIFSYLHKQV